MARLGLRAASGMLSKTPGRRELRADRPAIRCAKSACATGAAANGMEGRPTAITGISAGLLSSFSPLVREAIYGLRGEHPQVGTQSPPLICDKTPPCPLRLPSPAAIGCYLHQWPCFRRQGAQAPTRHPERPTPPPRCTNAGKWTSRWGSRCKTDPGQSAHRTRSGGRGLCRGDPLCAATRGHPPARATPEQVRASLRACFARWRPCLKPCRRMAKRCGPVGGGVRGVPFPLTLWLQGLGISTGSPGGSRRTMPRWSAAIAPSMITPSWATKTVTLPSAGHPESGRYRIWPLLSLREPQGATAWAQ